MWFARRNPRMLIPRLILKSFWIRIIWFHSMITLKRSLRKYFRGKRENLFAQGMAPAPNPAPDIDCSRNIDLADRELLRTSLRSGESSDLLTQ